MRHLDFNVLWLISDINHTELTIRENFAIFDKYGV